MVAVPRCRARQVASRSSSSSGVGRLTSAHPARLKLARSGTGNKFQLMWRAGSCWRRDSCARSQVASPYRDRSTRLVPRHAVWIGERGVGRDVPGPVAGSREGERGDGHGRYRPLSSPADQLAVGFAGGAGCSLALGSGCVVLQRWSAAGSGPASPAPTSPEVRWRAVRPGRGAARRAGAGAGGWRPRLSTPGSPGTRRCKGWPGRPNGLFVKSRHASAAVSSVPSASACSRLAAPIAGIPVRAVQAPRMDSVMEPSWQLPTGAAGLGTGPELAPAGDRVAGARGFFTARTGRSEP